MIWCHVDDWLSVRVCAGRTGLWIGRDDERDDDHTGSDASQSTHCPSQPARSMMLTLTGTGAIVLDGRHDAGPYRHDGERQKAHVEGKHVGLIGVAERIRDDGDTPGKH